MNRREQLAQLAGRDIELDCADYQGLQRLMQSLYEQLLVRNSAQIDALNQQITALLVFIGARANRRRKILTAVGLDTASANAMHELLKSCPLPNRDHLLQLWGELEDMVIQTKQLNERNGKLLAMHNEILSQIMGNSQSDSVYAARYY